MLAHPLRPHWSQNPRLFFFLLISVTVFGPAAIDFYLPAFPSIASQFNVSAAAVQATLSSFFAGFVIGMLVLGPLSDRFGRRPVLILSTVLYLLASIGCAFAPSLPFLTLMRLLQGIGGCAGQTIGRAMISDKSDRTETARTLSLIWMITALTPLVAPLIGGWVLEVAEWHAIFYIVSGLSFISLTLLVLALPETLPPERRHSHSIANMAQNYGKLALHKHYLAFCLSSASVMTGFFTYLGSAPSVFMTYFGVSAQNFGYFFGAIVSGFILGSFTNSKLVRKYGSEHLLKIGLRLNLGAAVFLNILTFTGIGGIYGVTIGMMFFTYSAAFIGGNAMAIGLSLFPKISGLASALMGMVQFGLGGTAIWIAGELFSIDPTARPMAAMILLVSFGGFCAYHFLGQKLPTDGKGGAASVKKLDRVIEPTA
ncbi:MAG: Bcr/CflA family multidrug efflux MFS transporter [Alphaproteobacteria bacterium]|nr:Bcr/CflA family multidrug efflux MFS transporter [Alphaproteobacteria bacterium]